MQQPTSLEMFRVNSQRVVYISSLHWVVIDWPDLLAPLSPLSGLVHPQPGSTGVNLAEEMSSGVNKPFYTTHHVAHNTLCYQVIVSSLHSLHIESREKKTLC